MSRIDNDLEEALQDIHDAPSISAEQVRDVLKEKLPDAIDMAYYCSGEAIDGNDDLLLEFAGHGPTFEIRIPNDT